MLADPTDAAANPFDFGDNANKAVRVNVVAGAGAGGGTSSNFGAAFPASGTAAGAKDNVGNMAALNLDALGQLKVVLPAGAGGLTDAELRASAVPVSVAALPLPAGAATEATLAGVLTTAAFQARINTLGQKAMAASTPVVLASDQSAIPVTGTFFQATQPISAVALPLPAGAATEATLATRLADATFTGRFPAAAALADAFANPTVTHIGAEPMLWNGASWDRARGTIANGMAVDVTRVQGNVAITAAALPLPAGAATEATLSAMSAKLPAVLVGGRLDVNVGASVAIDVSDRAARLIGDLHTAAKGASPAGFVTSESLDANHTGLTTVPFGSQGAYLQQRAVSFDLLVQLRTGAVEYDARQIRALTATDIVTANGDVDHDVANTLKVIQVGGNASPVDVPPAAVSANGDRVRAWLDRSGAVVVRRRKIRETYTAVFRLAEAAARLDQTFTHTANTNKQWATLHHLVGATKEVRLQLCIVWITLATTAAPQGILELRQISAAPATGNPAITPAARRRGGTAAEATCLYLPTTAGTEAFVDRPLAHFVTDEAVSVATAAFVHPQGYGRGGIVLYDASQEDDEAMQPVLPVATLDGWAVVTRMVGATVMRLTAMMVFTEEVP